MIPRFGGQLFFFLKLQSSIRVSKLTDLIVENIKFDVNIQIRIAGPQMNLSSINLE